MIRPIQPTRLSNVDRNERIQPILPYYPLPYRDESHTSFRYEGGLQRSRTGLAPADAAAAWAAACREARFRLQRLLDYRSSAWQERIVTADVFSPGGAVPGAAAGEAMPGAAAGEAMPGAEPGGAMPGAAAGEAMPGAEPDGAVPGAAAGEAMPVAEPSGADQHAFPNAEPRAALPDESARQASSGEAPPNVVEATAGLAPAALRGTAARGAAIRTYLIQVDNLAEAQQNVSFALAAEARSVVEPGRHSIAVDRGGLRTELSVEIGPAFSNVRTLRAIADTLTGAALGLHAAVKRDAAARTAVLSVVSEHTGTAGSFRLADAAEGTAVAATGIGATALHAAVAVYRVDGLTPVSASGNTVSLDAGKVTLTLSAATDRPVRVRVGVNAGAVVKQTADVVDAVNALAALHHGDEALLNPALLRELAAAMADSGMTAYGLSHRVTGGWALDGTKLLAAVEAAPEALRRRLTGPHGWAAAVLRTLERLEALPLESLFNPASHAMMAYTLYSASAGAYWQMPKSGWLFNDRT